jgi:hypothetical protein
MHRSASLATVIVLAITAAPLARTQGAQERRAEARAALAVELHDYAEWCRGRQFFLERRRVLEAVLVLAPGDTTAMRALDYTRDTTGRLVPPAKERIPRNFGFGDAAQAEARERYAAAIAPYLETMHALRADPSLTGTERASIVEELLLLVPDDPVLRAERGEVLRDGVWMMEEADAATRRRAELDEVVRTARSDTKLEPCEPDENERTYAFRWTATMRSAEARLIGTVPAAELDRTARALHAARALFGAVFERDGALPADLQVYLFASPEEGRAFLGQHAALTPEQIDRSATLAGLWLPDEHEIIYWASAEELRIDGVVRLALEVMMSNNFHTAGNQAWIHEGFGFLLAERVTGTRLSWFARADKAADQVLRVRMLTSGDWLGEAQRQFCAGEGGGPRFTDLEPLTFDTISPAELLYAYAVAAYLVEGRAGSAGRLLQRIGFGRRPADALTEIVGLDAETLDARVRRWLVERTPLPRSAERDKAATPGATAPGSKKR